jgi:hypothetical protein
VALCPVQCLLYYLVGEEEYQDGSNRREKPLNTSYETINRIHCILKYSSMGKAREGKQRQTRNNNKLKSFLMMAPPLRVFGFGTD